MASFDEEYSDKMINKILRDHQERNKTEQYLKESTAITDHDDEHQVSDIIILV